MNIKRVAYTMAIVAIVYGFAWMVLAVKTNRLYKKPAMTQARP